MGYALLQNSTLAVTAPTFNPVLSVGQFEISRGGSWPAYLEGPPAGVFTVGDDLYTAYMREPGDVYADGPVYAIGGNELATEWILDPPSWLEDPNHDYSRFTVHASSAVLSYLDHSDVEADADFTIDMIWRYRTTGETTQTRLFTGKCRVGGEAGDSSTGVGVTELEVWDIAGDIDREPFTININLDSNAYGCVVWNVGDECQLQADDTTNTVTIKSGAVLIDRRNVGGFNTPGSNWPFQGNGGGGSTGSSGSIVRVAISQTTLNLSSISGITINDPDNVGLKTILVTNGGSLTAIDGQAPPGAVPLYTFDLQYVGQVLTEERFRDAREISPPEEQKTRGEILKIALEQKGIDTSTFTYPTRYNDQNLRNPIQVMERPFTQWAREWCEPSLWRLRWGRSGTPEVWVDHILRSPQPVAWEIHQNNTQNYSVSGPMKGQASGDVTIRGVARRNLGLPSRTETKTTVDYMTRPDQSKTGELGGNRQLYGESGRTDKLMPFRVTEQKRVYVGNSISLEENKVYILRNVLNYKTNVAAKSAAWAGAPYLNSPTPPFPWDSEEKFIDYKYVKEKMLFAEETRIVHVYEGRVYKGWQKTEKRYHNPPRLSWGALPSGRTLPGWKYGNEQLDVVSDIQHKITDSPNGFIEQESTIEWAPYNIHISAEGDLGYPTPTGPSMGPPTLSGVAYYDPDEKLMKIAETVRRYSKKSREEIEIDTIVRTWEKKSGMKANSVGERMRTGGTMGHSEGVATGMQRSVEVVKGSLPVVAGLEDKIDRAPIGARVYSNTIESALGLEENVVNDEHPYVESFDMAHRLALWRFADGLSVTWKFLISINPAMALGDTVRVRWHTRGGLEYDFRGVVTSIAPAMAGSPQEAASMLIEVASDYNDLKGATMLGGRVTA